MHCLRHRCGQENHDTSHTWIISNLVQTRTSINPLNAELNPICHLLALLGAHHIFHVSGLRVNPLNTELNPICQ
jgi:hypothetical protein